MRSTASSGARRTGASDRPVVALMVGALLAAMLVALALGSTAIPLDQTLAALGSHFALSSTPPVAATTDTIVWLVRVPRVVLAALVGAALSLAGMQMQALFRNPLASPDVVGASSGAAFGAVVALATGLETRVPLTLPLFAFAGSVLTLLAVYALATRAGYTGIAHLLLLGIALNALIGAATSCLITATAHTFDAAQQVVFWLLGGLGGSSWLDVALVMPFVGVAFAVALAIARDLDLLVVGEHSARSLGSDVETIKKIVLANAALVTGAAVAMSGVIGFVGLVVPHVARLIGGASHRRAVPLVALIGATVVVLADLLARTAQGSQEVPLGVVTALVGAPVFLALVLRRRRAES